MMKRLRYLLVIIVLLSLGIFSVFYAPKNMLNTNNIENLEMKIDGWHFVRDIKLDAGTYAALQPKSLILRDYRNDKGHWLNLLVVYHQNDRWGAHNPNVCFTSQGWKIKKGEEKVNTITVNNREFRINKFLAERGSVTKLVYYYWFSSNKKFTASRNRQMLDMVLNGIVHGFTESGFVEISMALTLLNERQIISEINDFADKFTQILEKSL